MFTMPAGAATVTASDKKVFSGFSLQNSSSNKKYREFLQLRDENLLLTCAGKVCDSTTVNDLPQELDKESYGLCYGMSAAAVLDYHRDIAFAKNFASGDEILSAVKRSDRVESAIAYLQLLSVVPSVHTNRLEQVSFSATSDPAPRRLGMKKLIDNAENGEPIITKIVYNSTPPHMIVITGCKEKTLMAAVRKQRTALFFCPLKKVQIPNFSGALVYAPPQFVQTAPKEPLLQKNGLSRKRAPRSSGACFELDTLVVIEVNIFVNQRFCHGKIFGFLAVDALSLEDGKKFSAIVLS